MTDTPAKVKGGSPTSQARTRIALFTVTGLITCVVALGIVAERGISEESAACEQYGCVAESAPTEILLPQEPAIQNSVSASATASAIAEETDDVDQTDTVATADPVASASSSASASADTNGETPADGSAPKTPVLPENVADIEVKNEPDAGDQPSSGGHTTPERPIDGYPYDGKRCEDRYCGIGGVDQPMVCASYETTTGEEVYGCVDPRTYVSKGCFEITFHTLEGKPYSNLDTCSGELPYAPPVPPVGHFSYWDPSTASSRWTPERGFHYCQQGWHCGLDAVPEHYDCMVYFDTIHGTVRGCYERQRDCGPLHVYDETGRRVGIYEHYADCEKYQREPCGEDRCGLRKIPYHMECEAHHIQYGSLYGNYEETAYRCYNHELMKKYYQGELDKPRQKTCSFWIEPDGQRHRGDCIPDGGGEIAGEAGNDADAAEHALDQGRGRPETGGLDSVTRPAASEGPSESGTRSENQNDSHKLNSPIPRAIFNLLNGVVPMIPHTSDLEGKSESKSLTPAVKAVSLPLPAKLDVASRSTEQEGNHIEAVNDADLDGLLLPSGISAENGPLDEESETISENNGPSISRTVAPAKTEQRKLGGAVENNSVSVSGTASRDRCPYVSQATKPEGFGSSVGKRGLNGSAIDQESATYGRAREDAITDKVFSATWFGAVAPIVGLGVVGGASLLRRRFLK